MTMVDRQCLFFIWLAVDLTLEVLIAHKVSRRLKPWQYWWSEVQYTARYLVQFITVEVVTTAGFRTLTAVLFTGDSITASCECPSRSRFYTAAQDVDVA